MTAGAAHIWLCFSGDSKHRARSGVGTPALARGRFTGTGLNGILPSAEAASNRTCAAFSSSHRLSGPEPCHSATLPRERPLLSLRCSHLPGYPRDCRESASSPLSMGRCVPEPSAGLEPATGGLRNHCTSICASTACVRVYTIRVRWNQGDSDSRPPDCQSGALPLRHGPKGVRSRRSVIHGQGPLHECPSRCSQLSTALGNPRVDLTWLEHVTSCLRSRRTTNCATGPWSPSALRKSNSVPRSHRMTVGADQITFGNLRHKTFATA